MTIRNILIPLTNKIEDIENLRKTFESSSYTKSWALRSVICLSAVPQSIGTSFYYILSAIKSLACLQFKNTYNNLCLYKNNLLEILGYTITLVPTPFSSYGLSLVERCKKEEARYCLMNQFSAIKKIINKYDPSKPTISELKDRLTPLEHELDTLGYLNHESIHEFEKVVESLSCTPDLSWAEERSLYSHLSKSYSSIIPLAARLSPKLPQQKLQTFVQNPSSLFLEEKNTENFSKTSELPNLKDLFSVMHGDFTGSSLSPPSTRDLFTYLTQFIQKIRKGNHLNLQKIFEKQTHVLDNLENRFADTLDLEKLKKETGKDFYTFREKLIEKLVDKKILIIPSGYCSNDIGHRIYITFYVKEKRGKKWISGKISNLGEGTLQALFFDSQNRKRVTAEQFLNPTPLEKLEKSFFWKILLDLSQPNASTETFTTLTINDFNKTLLKEWPGGIGNYQKGDKKPQYAGSCTFASLKPPIHEILGKEYATYFLLGLYQTILDDYITHEGVDLNNVYAIKESSAHLARRLIKVNQQGQSLLLESINKTLSKVNQSVLDFENQYKETISKNSLPFLLEPFKETDKPLDFSIRESSKDYIHGLFDLELTNPQTNLTSLVYHFNCRDDDIRHFNRHQLDQSNYSNFLSICHSYMWLIYDKKERLTTLMRALQRIPPSKDPFWETEDGASTCYNLSRLLSQLDCLDKQDIDSDVASLILKGCFILFKFYANQIPDGQAIKDFYLKRIKSILQSDIIYLLRPIHPDHAKSLAETIDHILQESKHLPVSNLENLDFKIEIKKIEQLKNYPHLQYIHESIEQNPSLKEQIDSKLFENSSKTPLSRTSYFFRYYKKFEECSPLTNLFSIWEKFANLLFNTSSSQQLSVYSLGMAIFQDFDTSKLPTHYSPSLIKSYPELIPYHQELLPLLKKELPFNQLPKQEENQHLLQNKGLSIKNEGLPFYEVQGLLSITTYKDLSIDSLVKHFDRYFNRMKEPIFCSLFQTFLTQMFFEKGNSDNLLGYHIKHHSEQVFYLIDFLQRRRIDAQKFQWHEVSSFLFWMEGVVLSYLIREEKEAKEGDKIYEHYLETTQSLLEKTDRLFVQKYSNYLVSLAPYFEMTTKKESFLTFINQHVASASLDNQTPQQRLRLYYGLSFCKSHHSNSSIHLNNLSIYLNTPHFQGTYTYVENEDVSLPIQNSHPLINDTSFRSDLEYFSSENQKNHGLLFESKKIVPSYCIENDQIERLDNGSPTGLRIALDAYHSKLGLFFSRLTSLRNCYIWIDRSNQVVEVDYPILNLTFHFEADSAHAKTGKWMSSRHPGYFLDPSYQSLLFEPSSHYLALLNEKGHRLIYITSSSFQNYKTPRLMEANKMYVSNDKPHSLLTYHLSQEGEVDFSQTGEEELIYGIYLALQERNHKKASMWLNEWNKLYPLHTEKTAHLITLISDLNDLSPQATAIKIKLILSLINDPIYPSEGDFLFFTERLRKNYYNYLNQKNHFFPFSLSKNEKKQLKAYFDNFFDSPLDTLKEIQINHRSNEELKKVLTSTKSLLKNIRDNEISFNQEPIQAPTPINLSLRPGKDFVSNFLSYYQLAKSLKADDPQLKELYLLIRASQYDPSHEIQFCRKILKHILDYPYFFPPIETLNFKLKFKSNKNILTDLSNKSLYRFIDSIENIPSITLVISKIISDIKSYLFQYLNKINFVGMNDSTSFLKSIGISLLCFFRKIINHIYYRLNKTYTSLFNRIDNYPKKTVFIKPTVPKQIFSPIVSFNSQLAPPITSLLNLKNPRHCYLLIETIDLSQELNTLKDIQKYFTENYDVKRENCIQKEHDRFLEGVKEKIKELEELHGTCQYRINQNKIGELTQLIEKQKAHFDLVSRDQEMLILKNAHNYPINLQLEIKGGLLIPLTFNQLIIAFGRRDHAKILRSNPSLTEESLTNLENQIGDYLVAKTASDRLEKLIANLSKVQTLGSEKQKEIDILLSESLEILKSKRIFSGSQNPHLLVFEYFMKLTLRKNQIDFLMRLTEGRGDMQTLENIVEEAHTGFGKSKVAIPLWLYLTTQSARTAMITVPEPLHEEMRIHLKRVLGKAFDMDVTPIYFNRTDANNIKYLNYLNELLEDAEKNGKCLVISINSLHSLAVLKHKETYFKTLEGSASPKYFKALDQIRIVLANRVSNFVDESTECFYPRYSYDYSVGKKQSLKHQHIQAVRELYELVIEDETFLKKLYFDFLEQEIEKSNPKYIDSHIYETRILPHLIEKIIKKLNVPENFIPAVTQALSGKSHPDYQTYLETLADQKRQVFAIFRKELIGYLSPSLTLRWNERYKLGPDRIAYPARNGKLIPRSQFSSLDSIINLTYQANMRTPFTYKDIENCIERLIKNSLTKSYHEFRATIEYQTFATLSKGLNHSLALTKLTEEDKINFLNEVNRTLQNRLLFTEGFILPTFQFFPHKITSNPQLLCNRVGHKQGATGTANRNIPSCFKLNFDSKTIFRNLITLWQHSQNHLFSIPKKEGPSLLSHLFKNFDHPFNVIIDVAGYFRGFSSNKEIAKTILNQTTDKTPPIDAVGYIDEQGNNVLLMRGAQKSILREQAAIHLDRIFMFYSQEATVGFDIELPTESKALVTVGRQTRRDFFMQGVGRLRGLNKGMHASFLTLEDELETIHETLSIPKNHPLQFKDLFLYMFDLEAKKQADEAFDVMLHECHTQIEEKFWQKDLKLPLKNRKNLFKKVSAIFYEEISKNPIYFLYQTRNTVKMDENLNQTFNHLLDRIEKILKKSPELSKDYNLDKLKEELYSKCEKDQLREDFTQLSSSEPACSFNEVEQEQVEEQDLEINQIDNLDRDNHLQFTPKKPKPLLPYDQIEQYQKVSTYHPEHRAFISQNILCTDNLFQIALNSSKIYKKTMKPALYSLVIRNRKNQTYKQVLLDRHDTHSIYKQMNEDKAAHLIRNQNCDYYLIGNKGPNLLAQNGKEKWSQDLCLDPALRKLMIESRPYTGEPEFDIDDLTDLKNRGKKQQFLETIQSRFSLPWPYYTKVIETYSRID